MLQVPVDSLFLLHQALDDALQTQEESPKEGSFVIVGTKVHHDVSEAQEALQVALTVGVVLCHFVEPQGVEGVDGELVAEGGDFLVVGEDLVEFCLNLGVVAAEEVFLAGEDGLGVFGEDEGGEGLVLGELGDFDDLVYQFILGRDLAVG